jgi:hypothetical protein
MIRKEWKQGVLFCFLSIFGLVFIKKHSLLPPAHPYSVTSIKEEAQQQKESIKTHNDIEKVFSEILQPAHNVTLSQDKKSVIVDIAWEAKTPSHEKVAQHLIPTWEAGSSQLFEKVAKELGLTLTEVKTKGNRIVELFKKRFGS